MQTVSNQTSGAGTSKIDCAKECPCGVPVIPVPDQWLEVMVTGGFKVWHIIFIIIAFSITLAVVYCCFHRVRIPRTKQEIEADLMRTNMANKFRDYLQELPDDTSTFLEALKKVQDLEEKSEKDGAQMAKGARKRLGWLKLKGKGDKDAAGQAKGIDEKSNDVAQLEEKQAAPVSEIDPQKVVIPAEPEASLVQAVPTPLDLNIEPSNPTAGADEQHEPKVRPARRRKQKPNLSRTKRAKEKWNGDLEGHQRPAEVELEKPAHTLHDKPPSSAHDKPLEKAPNEKSPIRRPVKHHTHKVRTTEPKTLGPPDF